MVTILTTLLLSSTYSIQIPPCVVVVKRRCEHEAAVSISLWPKSAQQGNHRHYNSECNLAVPLSLIRISSVAVHKGYPRNKAMGDYFLFQPLFKA